MLPGIIGHNTLSTLNLSKLLNGLRVSVIGREVLPRLEISVAGRETSFMLEVVSTSVQGRLWSGSHGEMTLMIKKKRGKSKT